VALTPGTRIGSYEIAAQIGVGGMGEVYRARDTNLGRDVAIKVLPETFAQDPERLARFEREAKTLASLNHPNIAHIHGLAEANGVRAFVMELVEGPTLADQIVRGPIPINEALPIAKQIAEALEAAHDHGIIHRDLKPANIKVRPDGIVKVLDFGLAKALDPQDAAIVDATLSPTMSVHATQAGIILGTPAYMSPEQARGQTIDERADIWAFGCVLYEMLAGRPPFEGEDLAGILACVLEREPDWSRLPANVPARARELLRLCLEKNPKHRRRDAGDVRIDIERALSHPVAETAAAGTARTSRGAWRVGAVATLAGVVLTIPAMRYLGETSAPSGPAMRVEITPPPQSAPLEFALSPNGRHIVFVASADGRRRLWLRALNTVDAQAMTGTDGAAYPFWSADSRSIGYFASRKLYRIDVGGGPPQELADVPVGRGGTWNADGTIVFAPTDDGPLMRIAAPGSKPGAVTHLDPGQTGHRSPQFLPDGRYFLFLADGSPSASGLYLGSLDGGAPKRLMASNVAAAYLEPNLVVFVHQGALVARHLDVVRGELTGDSMTLADVVGYDVGFKLGAFSVSADGHVAYQARILKRDELFWVDRTGGASRVAVNELDVNRLANPDLSPNGRIVAVTLDSQSNIDIWLMDLAGRGGSTRFTFDAAVDAFPLWSPDGTQIVFSSARAGSPKLYLKPSNGAPGSERLLLEQAPAFPEDWSRDGRFLLYMVLDPKTGLDLWTVDMTEKQRTPRPLVNTSSEERNGQFSPDGHWLAYQTHESGRPEVVVVSFPDPTEKRRVSTSGGTQARWRADGKELYFVASDGRLMAAPITIARQAGGSRIEVGAPVSLFQTRMVGPGAATGRAQYAVARDGRFLISQPEESATTPITLILNWKPPASEITR
jgi:serine/threonine protein kinase/Tol biopolymer transport system component